MEIDFFSSGEKKISVVSGARRNNEQQIMEFVEKNGFIVRSDVDSLLGVSQSTASRILKRMVVDGLLYQDGVGRNTKFLKR